MFVAYGHSATAHTDSHHLRKLASINRSISFNFCQLFSSSFSLSLFCRAQKKDSWEWAADAHTRKRKHTKQKQNKTNAVSADMPMVCGFSWSLYSFFSRLVLSFRSVWSACDKKLFFTPEFQRSRIRFSNFGDIIFKEQFCFFFDRFGQHICTFLCKTTLENERFARPTKPLHSPNNKNPKNFFFS